MRRNADKRERHKEELAEWHHGTDLRNSEGYYGLPIGVPCPVANPEPAYVSVTTVLDAITDFTYPERWWIASEVVSLAQAAVEKRLVSMWNPSRESLVEVMPGKIILNQIADDAGFGTNAGKWWIAKAGGRELQRRANRGTLIHDAFLDWIFNGIRVSFDDVEDYARMLAEAREFALDPGYYVEPIRNAIAWADRHLDPDRATICESPLYNWDYIYAGTCDYLGPLRNTDSLVVSPSESDENGRPLVANASEIVTGIIVRDSATWMLDFKGSKGPKPAHRMQIAAYSKAHHYVERSGVTAYGAFREMPPVDRFANVYVQAEYVHLKEWGSEDDTSSIEDSYAAFLHAQMVFFHLARESQNTPDLIKAMSIKPPTREQFARYRAGGR